MKLRTIFIVSLVVIILFSSCNRIKYGEFGKVFNPKLPDFSKPANIFYCEKDEDCAITSLNEDNCCWNCGMTINKEGKKYIDKWHELNCNAPEAVQACEYVECTPTVGTICENNKCVGFTGTEITSVEDCKRVIWERQSIEEWCINKVSK